MEQKYFTPANRILHWLIAFTYLFILLTVFLRMYWLNRDHSTLNPMDVHLSRHQAVSNGKAIRKPMWD